VAIRVRIRLATTTKSGTKPSAVVHHRPSPAQPPAVANLAEFAGDVSSTPIVFRLLRLGGSQSSALDNRNERDCQTGRGECVHFPVSQVSMPAGTAAKAIP